MELQPDRSRFRPARLTGVLRNQRAVELYPYHVSSGFDVACIPVVLDLMTGFGSIEQVDAPGRVLVAASAVEDLDLIADVGRRALGIVRGANGVLPAGRVADRHTAVAAVAGP